MDDHYVLWAERFSNTGMIERYEKSTVLGGGLVLVDNEPRGMDQINIRLAIARAEKAAFAAGYTAAQKAMRKAMGV